MHKVLFYIGSVPVFSYGFMIAVGFLFSILLGIKLGKARGINSEKVIQLENLVLLTGIIGARLLYVLLNFEKYADNPVRIIDIRSGGLSWHGGVIVGIISIYLFARKEKLPFRDISDLSMISGLFGLAFGRVGCFLHGCCYGKTTGLPWGTVFPDQGMIPRHPTQIYECILDLLILFILIYLWKRNKFGGEVTCAFIGLYSLARFIVEFFRENSSSSELLGPLFLSLNLAQIFSIILIIFSIILYIKLHSGVKSEG